MMMENNTSMHAFAQTPTVKIINKTCSKRKLSILSNIPALIIYHNSYLNATSRKDTMKNALGLNVDATIMRVNVVENDLKSV